jgi:hypothetical protein
VGEKEKYFHKSSNKSNGEWFGEKRKEIKYTQQKGIPNIVGRVQRKQQQKL